MVKKIFLIVGLLISCPISYQVSLTNQLVVLPKETTDLNTEEVTVENKSTQEESEKNISRSARKRWSASKMIGVTLGIIIGAIVALGIAVFMSFYFLLWSGWPIH